MNPTVPRMVSFVSSLSHSTAFFRTSTSGKIGKSNWSVSKSDKEYEWPRKKDDIKTNFGFYTNYWSLIWIFYVVSSVYLGHDWTRACRSAMVISYLRCRAWAMIERGRVSQPRSPGPSFAHSSVPLAAHQLYTWEIFNFLTERREPKFRHYPPTNKY